MVPKSEILWVDASYHAIHQVLSNPVYAGAYTYGRTRQETTLDGSGVPKKRMRHLPRSEWQVLIKEHHEAISIGEPTKPTKPGWPPTPALGRTMRAVP
jgi:hypothetical protein